MKKTLVYMLVLCFGIGLGISVLGCGGEKKPAPGKPAPAAPEKPAEKPKT